MRCFQEKVGKWSWIGQSSVTELYQELLRSIESELQRLVPRSSLLVSPLYEGARYSLFSGGKRIRPLLTLAISKQLQGSYQTALRPACALELIHTYSLIHDDLPSMDDDDFRRGKPTLHKVVTEGQAILVGDFLLTYAFEVLAEAPSLSADQRLHLTALLAKVSGAEGMVGGQWLDISSIPTSIEELHKRKTGALFQAALQFGGVVSHASPSLLRLLGQLGLEIGWPFQVIDDIVDQDGHFSLADVEKATLSARSTLDKLPGDATLMHDLIDKITAQVPSVKG